MPHVVWRYPFRYFKELRDHLISVNKPREESGEQDTTFDWEDESLAGPPV